MKLVYELVMYEVREPEVVHYVPYEHQATQATFESQFVQGEVDRVFHTTSRLDGAAMGGYLFRVGDNYCDYVFAFIREV